MPGTASENVRAEFRCLGTLISFNHVLTLASCVSGLAVDKIVVNVGSTALLGEGDNSVIGTLAEIDIHPDFVQGQPLKGNIAILTVSLKQNVRLKRLKTVKRFFRIHVALMQ